MDVILLGLVAACFAFIGPGLIMAIGLVVPLYAVWKPLRLFLFKHSIILELGSTYLAYQMHKGSWAGTMGAVVCGLSVGALLRILRRFEKPEADEEYEAATA